MAGEYTRSFTFSEDNGDHLGFSHELLARADAKQIPTNHTPQHARMSTTSCSGESAGMADETEKPSSLAEAQPVVLELAQRHLGQTRVAPVRQRLVRVACTVHRTEEGSCPGSQQSSVRARCVRTEAARRVYVPCAGLGQAVFHGSRVRHLLLPQHSPARKSQRRTRS